MTSAASTATAAVSQAELARTLGVSRQAVGDLVARGILVVDATGKIDPAAAAIALRNQVRPSGKTAAADLVRAATDAATATPPAADKPQQPATPPAGDPVTSYHVARTLREAAEASLAQLKLRRQCNELVDREIAIQAAFTAFRSLRDQLTYTPRRVAATCAGMTDSRQIQLYLEQQLRETLDAFQRRVIPQLVTRMGEPGAPIADATDREEDQA